MAAMDFPNSPTNGTQTADGRYYFDSSVGSTGAWRSTPLPVGGLPAGSIMAWGTNTPPANWLLADGSAVSRSVYSSLFAVIGTQYGTGDGTTTFNLPDLRGRVPVGKNAATFGTLGATGGAETHTLSIAEMPSHTHGPGNSYNASDFNTNGGASQNVMRLNATGFQNFTTGSTGGGGSHNNLQPYQVVNYIIKTSAGWTAGDSELETRLGAVEQKQILSDNYVINGGFDIWQRGTSFAAPATVYSANTADRWNSFRGGFATGFTVSRQSAGLTGFQYCARIQRDSGNTSAAQITFNQTLESVSSIPLAGKVLTLSFYARAGANFSPTGGTFNLGFVSGTGTDQNVQQGFTGNASVATINAALTSSWQRFSVTGTVPSGSTQVGLAGGFTPVGTAGANDYMEITGVQLEEGSVPTPFRRSAPSIQAELAACQRYYEVCTTSLRTHSSSGYIGSTLPFKVEKRVVPTVTRTTNGTSGGGLGAFQSYVVTSKVNGAPQWYCTANVDSYYYEASFTVDAEL